MDKFGYKKINIIISFIEIAVSFTIYFLVIYDSFFTIEVFLISCCLSGIYTTMAPLFNKVFGKEIVLEIYGISIIFFSISDIPILLINEFLLIEKRNYLIAYLIGGVISLMKLIALIFFKENELYKSKSDKEENVNNTEKVNDLGIDN